MPGMPRLAAFLIAAGLLTLTPGVDTALVLRTTARAGRSAGVAAVFGISTGVLGWGAASGAGLSALLVASPTAFLVLRYLGAGYLVLLGLRSLLARAEPFDPDRGDAEGAGVDRAGSARGSGRRGTWSAYRTGLLTNLLNPKVGVFYAAFLPPFIPAGAPVLPTSIGLAALHVTMGTLWLSALVLMIDRAGRLLRRQRVRRALDRVTGVVLLGFGVRLAALAR